MGSFLTSTAAQGHVLNLQTHTVILVFTSFPHQIRSMKPAWISFFVLGCISISTPMHLPARHTSTNHILLPTRGYFVAPLKADGKVHLRSQKGANGAVSAPEQESCSHAGVSVSDHTHTLKAYSRSCLKLTFFTSGSVAFRLSGVCGSPGAKEESEAFMSSCVCSCFS